MAIYFDGVYLAVDTVEELHIFAERLEIKRCWFQNHPKHPHYDCTNKNKTKVLMCSNVLFVNSRFIVELFKAK